MSKYETQIQHAMEVNPPVYLGDLKPSTNEKYSLLQELPDDSPISLNGNGLPKTHGNRIVVPTLEELFILQSETYALLGRSYDLEAVDQLSHEREHAEAASLLGSRATVFAMRFMRILQAPDTTDYTVGTQLLATSAVETTKLGMAAIAARPNEPSAGDYLDLEEMGYNGIEEVGFKALRHNQTHDDIMPIPLSYTPTNKTYIP